MGRFEERYELTRQLGSGAAGDVYLAILRETGAPVAIKFFRPEGDAIPQSKERFLQEAKVAAGIRNDHVVRVLDAGVTGDRHFFAMEYAEGADLHDFLVEHGPLEKEHCAELAGKMAEGVAAIHAAGVIHRDLKPANVILVDAHTPKIADFGLARFTGGSKIRTRTGVILGTPGYLGPELLLGQPLTPAADVYALGMIVFFLYQGDSPFGTTDFGKLLQAQTQGLPMASFEGLPREVALMVMRMTALEPGDRPGAEEVAEFWKGGATSTSPKATAVLSTPRGDAPEATKVSAAPGAKALSVAAVSGGPGGAEPAAPPPGRWVRALPGALVLLLGLGWLAWPAGEPAAPAKAVDPFVTEVGEGATAPPPGPDLPPEDLRVEALVGELEAFQYATDLPGLLAVEGSVDRIQREKLLRDTWTDRREGFLLRLRTRSSWYGAWKELRPLLDLDWWTRLPSGEVARDLARDLRVRVAHQLVALRRLNTLDQYLGGDGDAVEGLERALEPAVHLARRFSRVGRGDQVADVPLDARCLMVSANIGDHLALEEWLSRDLPPDSPTRLYCDRDNTVVLPRPEIPLDAGDVREAPEGWLGIVMGLRDLGPTEFARLELLDDGGFPVFTLEVPGLGLEEWYFGGPTGKKTDVIAEYSVPRLAQVRVRNLLLDPPPRAVRVRLGDLLAPVRPPDTAFLLMGIGRLDSELAAHGD